MDKPFSGGYSCDAVRYTVVADPVFSGNRHGRDCQRASGSAFAPTLMVAGNGRERHRYRQYYEEKADSGHTTNRGFCPSCGSQLFGELEAFPGVLGIRTGTMDDPCCFNPTLDFYTSSAPCWVRVNSELPKFAMAPAAP